MNPTTFPVRNAPYYEGVALEDLSIEEITFIINVMNTGDPVKHMLIKMGELYKGKSIYECDPWFDEFRQKMDQEYALIEAYLFIEGEEDIKVCIDTLRSKAITLWQKWMDDRMDEITSLLGVDDGSDMEYDCPNEDLEG
jgi:hypothetical protein